MISWPLSQLQILNLNVVCINLDHRCVARYPVSFKSLTLLLHRGARNFSDNPRTICLRDQYGTLTSESKFAISTARESSVGIFMLMALSRLGLLSWMLATRSSTQYLRLVKSSVLLAEEHDIARTELFISRFRTATLKLEDAKVVQAFHTLIECRFISWILSVIRYLLPSICVYWIERINHVCIQLHTKML